MEDDLIEIAHDVDDEGEELEEAYVVRLQGAPADLYSLSHEYCDNLVSAYEFADEVSKESGVPITWECPKPGWI